LPDLKADLRGELKLAKPGQGGRAGSIGSLLLGVPDRGQLRDAGHGGTSFNRAMLADLARGLARLRRAARPFTIAVPAPHAQDARWVEPRLAGEVALTEWAGDQVLRHPAGAGYAPTSTPATCTGTAEIPTPDPSRRAWRQHRVPGRVPGPHARCRLNRCPLGDV